MILLRISKELITPKNSKIHSLTSFRNSKAKTNQNLLGSSELA
jgi:hypothetical protein